MICPRCGTALPDGVPSCGRCGQSFSYPPPAGGAPLVVTTETSAERVVGMVTQQVSHVAGVEQLRGFSLRELFSAVFTRHTDDEIEESVAVGTRHTTPSLQEVDTRWPKPWAFARALIFSLLLYAAFTIAWMVFKNGNLIPGLIIVGSFAMPFAVLIFFWEMNTPRNVSLYQVIKLLLLGGITSIFFSLFIFAVTNFNHMLGPSSAGIVEEAGKVLALLFVLNNPRFRYTLNGLLFGAAVGAGFAIFESAGYALRFLLEQDTGAMFNVILLRGLLAPAGHIVWTALTAAALWKIKGAQPFSFKMFFNLRFLRVYLLVMVLHGLWNAPFEFPFFLKQLLLGLTGWIAVLSFVQDGLKQLRAEQRAHQAQMATSSYQVTNAKSAVGVPAAEPHIEISLGVPDIDIQIHEP